MAVKKRPNVLILLADDLGYSDIGCFGSEIATPHIDQIASEGMRMTSFHVAAACSPTRSMLLSGTDHHIAGIGTMAERITNDLKGQPGYEGYLNDRVVALQELLRDGGYETLMSGKWHLGLTPDRVPHARGFERSFSMLSGCHNHYGYEPDFDDKSTIPRIAAVLCRMYERDGVGFGPDKLPKDFYSTDAFTDNLLNYLQDRVDSQEERPFFAYLPFTAPHWPLQAPEESIRKYHGKYDDGWDALRLNRVTKLKAMGLVPEQAVPAPVISKGEDGRDTKNWKELTKDEKQLYSRKMEVEAAMIDRIDENIGRVIDHLKKTGQYDNTIIMFFSDNGAEGAQHDLENMGRADSFIWYGARWASASTAPGLLYKMFTSEGGIRVPFVIRYPPLIEAGSMDHSFTTVMDIMPTILDVCGIKHPGKTYQGRDLAPMSGSSWLPYLRGQSDRIHSEDHVTGWELFGRRAVRQGQWKGLFIPKPYGPEKWQLFNILDDPGEVDDLSEEVPDKMKHMIALYEDYCKVNGVISQSPASRAGWSDMVK